MVWATTIISPILKKGSKDYITNYRPISLPPLLYKILVKAVSYQVMKYLKSKRLIDKNFSGYRRFNSTATALIQITVNILRNIERCLVASLTFTDLYKAFGKVDHNELLVKLSKYGI